MLLSKQIILLLAQLRELSVHIKIIMSTTYKLHITLMILGFQIVSITVTSI